MKTENKFHNYV